MPDSPTGLETALRALAAVTLEELTSVASLQTRRDQKYIVPVATVSRVIAELGPGARALELDDLRAFRYESVYFDTPDLDSFFDAAHSRPRRSKIRTRSYLDSGSCAVEVKARDRGGETVKHRHPHPIDRRTELTAGARRFITEVDPTGVDPAALQPTLTTAYRRATLLIADESRTTIDVGLRCTAPDGRSIAPVDTALVETKSIAGSTPVDRLLWRHGHRPTSISKYCVGMAALHPHLPANKWHRVLRRHFGWTRAHVPVG